jgi:ribosomal protein S24E
MEIREESISYNPIFKRRELTFFLDHISLSSPLLYVVRKSLAEKYDVNEDVVYIMRLDTKTGTNRAYGKAEIYDSYKNAVQVVPKHIQRRNMSSRRTK